MNKTLLNYLIIVFIAFKSVSGEASIVLETKNNINKFEYTVDKFLGNLFDRRTITVHNLDDSFSTIDEIVSDVEVLKKLNNPHEVVLLADKLDKGDYLNSQVTAYCMGQITSTGKRVKEGYIAASRDLIKKLGYGKDVLVLQQNNSGINIYGRYRIEDTMASYIRNTFDIYMKKERDCLNFGRRKMKIVILD